MNAQALAHAPLGAGARVHPDVILNLLQQLQSSTMHATMTKPRILWAPTAATWTTSALALEPAPIGDGAKVFLDVTSLLRQLLQSTMHATMTKRRILWVPTAAL